MLIKVKLKSHKLFSFVHPTSGDYETVVEFLMGQLEAETVWAVECWFEEEKGDRDA